MIDVVAELAASSAFACRRTWLCLAAIFLVSYASDADAQNDRRIVCLIEESTLSAWKEIGALAREFESENPGVRVQMIDGSGASGARDKVKFMLAGGLPLDLVRIDVTEFAGYLADGALLDLDEHVRRDPTFRADDYFSVLDAFRDRRGHLFGMVQTFTPYVMYVNRTMLRDLGIDDPAPDWTWADFLATAKRVTADTDGDGKIDRFGISLTQWFQAVLPWIWQAGGEVLDAEGQRCRLDSAEAIEAFEFLQGLLFREKVASFDATFEDQLRRGLFQAGRTAFYGPVGYWETYRFRGIDEFEWDVVPLPRHRRAATAVAMQGYVVPRTSGDPELAYRFLRKLTARKTQAMYAAIGNGVPGLRIAAESDDFLQPGRAPKSARVYLDCLPFAKLTGPYTNWRTIEGLIQADLEGLLLSGNLSPSEAARRMTRKIDEHLSRERETVARPRINLGRNLPKAAWAAVGVVVVAAYIFLRANRGRVRDRRALFLLLPWAFGLCAFTIFPALASIAYSFTAASPVNPTENIPWVGGDNFARLSGDPRFRESLFVTAIYAAASVPIGLFFALALALLVRRDSSWSAVLRTALYLPSIISPVVVAAQWRIILDADQGLLNAGLATVGIDAVPWLRAPGWVIASFVVMSLWTTGGAMLVFLSGLKSIDPRLIEAARLDGAGPWARLRHVILPALRETIVFNGVVGTVNAFQIFAPAFVLTQGGPGDSSRFLVLLVYETAFRNLDLGYASAMAWTMLGIIASAILLPAAALKMTKWARARS